MNFGGDDQADVGAGAVSEPKKLNELGEIRE